MKKKELTKGGKDFKLNGKIYQTNPLIQARKDFNIIGTRLFLLGLRSINPQLTKENKNADAEFKPLFISTSKVREIFGNDRYLTVLKDECRKLFNAVVELKNERGEFTLMHMFRKLEYVPRDGYYLQFDELMRPYLLDLFESEGYTMINVEQIFPLSSTYSVRLIELMLQYQNIKPMKERGIIERLIKLDELRFMLNVPEGAYEGRLYNFCSKVLDGPIREINEKTLYKMSYETVKLEHKQIAFQFTFDMTAVVAKEAELNASGNSAINKLRSIGFNETAARDIRDKCSSDEDCLKRITNAIRSLNMRKKYGADVENELGYLRTYIEENWQSAATKAKRKASAKREAQKRQSRKSGEPEAVSEVFSRIFPPVKPSPKPTEEDRTLLPAELKTSLLRAREPAAEEFIAGEHPLGSTVADIAVNALAKGELLETIEALLKSRGFTIERFRELYMT